MIIAVLTMIIGLAWNNWIYRTRIKSANTKAKVIFNAAQTACTEYQQSERKSTSSKYIDNGEFYYYWESESVCGEMDLADALPVKALLTTASGDDLRFGRKINKIIDDEVVYKIYIKNYKVVSVTCSRFADDRYVGAYPKSTDVAGVTPATVRDSQMTDFGV